MSMMIHRAMARYNASAPKTPKKVAEPVKATEEVMPQGETPRKGRPVEKREG